MLDQSPLVDVVIPSRGREDLTHQAVQSVLNQTYKNIALYLIVDGRPKPDYHWLSEYNSDKRFSSLVLNKSHGPSYCRNLGARCGKGRYVAFLDNDDLWKKDKIEIQAGFLENHPEYLWAHTDELWLRNGIEVKQHKIHQKQGGIFIEKLLERCLISPSAVMFRKDFFIESGGFLESFRVAEDYELWLRLNLHFPVGFIDAPLTIKRAGSWEQLSSTREIDRWRVKGLLRFYKQFKNDPDFQSIFPFWQKVITQKTAYLLKGALKHNNQKGIKRYQYWSNLVTIERTLE